MSPQFTWNIFEHATWLKTTSIQKKTQNRKKKYANVPPCVQFNSFALIFSDGRNNRKMANFHQAEWKWQDCIKNWDVYHQLPLPLIALTKETGAEVEWSDNCTHHNAYQMPCLPSSKPLGQIWNFDVVNQERADCWRYCNNEKSVKHQPAGIGSRETKHLHKYNQTKWKQKLTSDVIHHVTNSTGKALEEWRSRVQTWLRIMTTKFRNSHACNFAGKR